MGPSIQTPAAPMPITNNSTNSLKKPNSNTNVAATTSQNSDSLKSASKVNPDTSIKFSSLANDGSTASQANNSVQTMLGNAMSASQSQASNILHLNSLLDRIGSLAVRSTDIMLNANDKAIFQQQIDELHQEANRVSTASFNGTLLFENPTTGEVKKVDFSAAEARARGGKTEEKFIIDTGTGEGELSFSYEAFRIPDQFQILQDGNVIFDTGRISGRSTEDVKFSGNSKELEVVVNNGGGLQGTAWEVSAEFTSFNVTSTNGKSVSGEMVLPDGRRINLEGVQVKNIDSASVATNEDAAKTVQNVDEAMRSNAAQLALVSGNQGQIKHLSAPQTGPQFQNAPTRGNTGKVDIVNSKNPLKNNAVIMRNPLIAKKLNDATETANTAIAETLLKKVKEKKEKEDSGFKLTGLSFNASSMNRVRKGLLDNSRSLFAAQANKDFSFNAKKLI